MTKSFSLSVLVAALSAAAVTVPLAVWAEFSITGRQGVSALPAFFPIFLTVALWLRCSRTTNRAATITCLVTAGAWYGLLWFAALTQPHIGGFATALARAVSELLYSASPVVLVGIAGGVACLGLMMSASPVRGPLD